jgi:hypothetical protein
MESTPRMYLLGSMAFLILGLTIYSNTFQHEFQLDSTYGIVDNPAIRSLDNVPHFFTDPFTLTSLRQNADYRPILQVTYALNYAVSGLDMWSWHLTNLLLHVMNALLLVVFTGRWLPYLSGHHTGGSYRLIPWFVGFIFLIHPTASGVINYQWARSSLLTATFALPAILFWMAGRRSWAAVFYTLALFTKVEAVGILGAFALWTVFQSAHTRRETNQSFNRSFLSDVASCISLRSFNEFLPVILITAS